LAWLIFQAKLLLAALTFQARHELDQNQKAKQNDTDQRFWMDEIVFIFRCISGIVVWFHLVPYVY